MDMLNNSETDTIPFVYKLAFAIACLIVIQLCVRYRAYKIRKLDDTGYDQGQTNEVYSPPRYILVAVACALPAFWAVMTGFFYFSKEVTSPSILGFVFIGAVLSLVNAVIFLSIGKKIFLEEDGLAIKRLLPFVRARKIQYNNIQNIYIGKEYAPLVSSRIASAAGVPILYIHLKNNRKIRLDLPDEVGSKNFLETLMENVNRFNRANP